MNRPITRQLSSLGCNFAVQESDAVADPEKTILMAIDYFWIDKKIFTMLIAVLKYRISHLINVKRLHILSKKIDTDKKLILSVVAAKVGQQTGDIRFTELAKKLKKPGEKVTRCPAKYQDNYYLERKGVDRDFKKVGLEIADFFEEQTEKKLKTIKKIYLENDWLRLRALSGPDYRADTLYLLKAGLAKNQSEVAKWLQCNKSSVSRIWSSIKNIHELAEII
ncbi:MAG: hypothetical protein H6626_09330 [Pseudobdellovibrionaceae bacterium]|nr:hypothetical protein [Bdellovibrionales bacterium]USN46417.1 MAG: hypothetical protein H6626_09330 [Pseudobdellovibrionaceae bacterium]